MFAYRSIEIMVAKAITNKKRRKTKSRGLKRFLKRAFEATWSLFMTTPEEGFPKENYRYEPPPPELFRF